MSDWFDKCMEAALLALMAIIVVGLGLLVYFSFFVWSWSDETTYSCSYASRNEVGLLVEVDGYDVPCDNLLK